jgi:hypothetical protein
MGTGYTRNDTPNNIADGNVINASDLDGEFDAIQTAFNASTGHSHDGTTGEGPQIAAGGIASDAVTTAKILDGNVTTAKIADVNVTTAKIANDAVTGDKLANNIQIAGTLGVTGETTLTTHLNMGDNDIIKLGDSADLQIYHDGSHSYIKDAGTGSLRLLIDDFNIRDSADSQNMMRAFNDGSVELYHNGDKKLETTSSGIDVTGTVTADELTVKYDRAGTSGGFILYDDNQSENRLTLSTGGGTGANLAINQSGGSFNITDASLNNIATFADNGDISFYEDTGTTAKFFWDASAESLGIGTSSPTDYNANIDDLVIANSASGGITIATGTTSQGAIAFADGTSASDEVMGRIRYDHNVNEMDFRVNNAEAMRIDSSGNLLVGKTSADTTVEGFQTRAGAITAITRDGNLVLNANRLTSDGDIMVFQKDSTTIGSIGTNSNGNFQIFGTVASHVGLQFGSPSILPIDNSGASDDNAVDLGDGSVRFKDLYLSGGVYLGGTGSANKLDDYEEGTWTPSFLAATNPTVTYSVQLGYYRKIGDTVYIICRIVTDSVSGGSGAVRIGGLPFTSKNITGLTSSGAVTANNWTGEHPMKFRIPNNGTDIYLYYRTSIHTSDLNANTQTSDLNTGGGVNVTEITATYFT